MRIELAPAKTCSIVATASEGRQDPAAMRDAELRRRREIFARAPSQDPLVRRLVRAADHYIVELGDGKTIIAGYHWFSDWGRDTMISLPGLTLVTGRHEAARSILGEFAKHVSRGMLPNRFPDAGEKPDYNSVDAALWFFEAARAYLAYTHDEGFVLRELYPKLKEIIECNLAGTRHGIRVDNDGLVHAGEPGTQLTWIDAKIGDWVVTPRVGKPVEVQALWYNALRIQQDLARKAGDSSAEAFLREMAEHVRLNFNRFFWNDKDECLYDVVNGETQDAAIRPNQVLAASLPHPIVDRERARKLLCAVETHLLTPMGLRTVASSDPAYRPRYEGGVVSRDSAYHQGTVWPWLMGPFLTAYLTVYADSDSAHIKVKGWLSRFDEQLRNAGLGHISEVADGDRPHVPGGCIAQAWSTAELLRAIVEWGRQSCPQPASAGRTRPKARTK